MDIKLNDYLGNKQTSVRFAFVICLTNDIPGHPERFFCGPHDVRGEILLQSSSLPQESKECLSTSRLSSLKSKRSSQLS